MTKKVYNVNSNDENNSDTEESESSLPGFKFKEVPTMLAIQTTYNIENMINKKYFSWPEQYVWKVHFTTSVQTCVFQMTPEAIQIQPK